MSAEKTLYTKSFFNNIDLTEQCLTFPKIPRNEIYRESLIKHLSQMFSPERQVIMVEGIPASGKTTLLAQFARYFAKKSFSFFIGEDYLSSNYIRFQIDMCEQMKFWSRKNIQSISAENEQQLKTLFNFLYTDLIKEARHGNGPFYFVIDGIDLLHNDENNILNYLPKVQDNIYLLLSSNSPLKLNFPYDRWPIPPFSLEETEKYLNNYLKQEHIKKIFTISEGMPGYLAQIYREIQQGISVEEIINNIPLEFNQLLEKEWIRNNISEKNILDILAVVTFSPELVTIKELKDILEIDELKIRKIIKTISFIEEDSETQKIRFAMSAYKDFLESKLGDLRIEIDQKLIKYYEKNDGNENAFVHLPVLYKRTDNFSALGSLLSVDSLLNKFGTTKNTSFVRKNLRIYSGMAFNKKEWQRLSWSALAEAIFTSITTTPPTLENEIDALLALDNYTEALKHSCKCILPEDRLQLLARTFNYMRKKDIDISNDLVKILEDCVNQIDNIPDLSVDMVEKLLDACGYILPVHAKLALRIIERIISEKGTKEYNDNLMDFLVTKLLVTVGPEIDSTEDLESQITNESLRDFARAASSKVAGISEEKILEEVDQISDTSVKMFLLQSWCNTNSKNANAYKVIKEALRILTESVGYSPTQRQLRHLTKPLLNCENETETRELLKQIDILKATILQAPIDEYVRLELVLATIERKWSKKAAEERLYSVYFSLDEKVYDLDSRCHILIRILLSLPEIISDDERLKEEFEQQFKNEFEKLLKSSAEHFTATKKIFSALTIYNYNFALNYAAMLNTAYRRDLTYFEILKSYTDQRLENVEFDLINKALDKIENVLIRDRTLVQVIRRLSRKGSAISKQQKLIFYESVNNISTPTNKAYACAYYIRWIGDEDGKLIETLFFNLLGSLYSIDELWERVKAGFNLSRIIGDVKKDLAKILFEKTLNEKNKSIFFEERIIELYKNTCSIAIRMVPDVFKSVDYLDKINRIIQLIQTIPSSIEQCELLSSLALRCHTAGREDLFKKVTHICIDIIENVKNENVLECVK